MVGSSDGERIARLETMVDHLYKAHEEHEANWSAVNKKLDDLLALRNKGIGAFWVASSLIGTGIVSFVWQVVDWFKHVAGG